MRSLNLLLAVFWLFLGGALIVVSGGNPDSPFTIRGTQISGGWIAVFLAVYNLVRWWVATASAPRADPPRPPRPQAGPPRPLPEPDPTFDFTKPSPPPEGEGPPGPKT